MEGLAFVLLLRLLLPLTILRFSLFGGVISIVADYFDLQIMQFFGGDSLASYQIIDKALDMYYLSLESFVVLKWKNNLVRYSSISLYIHRFMGFFLFILTDKTWILLFFPNIFEVFYLYYLGYKKIFKKDPVTNIKTLLIILYILLLPKLLHEYFLHVNTTHPWTENKYIKIIRGI